MFSEGCFDAVVLREMVFNNVFLVTGENTEEQLKSCSSVRFVNQLCVLKPFFC